MDSAPSRTTKPSSNISTILLRFSKLCRLRSAGVISSSCKTPKPSDDPYMEDCSTEETDRCDNNQKIHPHPLEETLVTSSDSEEAVISKLFAAISALKSSYVQLQQAHIPYEAKKFRSADERVVAELESLSELEHLFVEEQRSKPKSQSSLLLEIEEHQCLLEKLQSDIRTKDTKILNLRWELEELDRKNAEVEEEIRCGSSPEQVFLPLHCELTPSVFYDVFQSTSKSIHDFAKPLISLMKASGWDLDRAASSIDESVIYAERSHKKYAFEAYLCRVMLGGAQEEHFKPDHLSHAMSFEDPFDALFEEPDSNFARFCRSKYVVAVQSKMEGSFFGNLDQRAFVMSGKHPNTPFYRAFVRMAKWVWTLQVMASSITPEAEMFYVKRGKEYLEECMESVVNHEMVEGEERLKVGLMVMPGFRIGGNVIRCKVYLTRTGMNL